MTFALVNVLIVGALFGGMLALQEAGRRLGERDRRKQPGNETRNAVAAEGAVYGLLGLFIAFTFYGAGARYEERRHLAVEEANAIGTAWRRIDMLPEDMQSDLRDFFRQYADARLDYYRHLPNLVAVEPIRVKLRALQDEIWSSGVAAAYESGRVPLFTVFLPALNEMIDITTTREEAIRLHPPAAVFLMVAILALIGSVFAGYGMAGRARSWVHTLGFAAVITMALFVILDLEFPRLGLIRVDAADSMLLDVRRSMR